MVKTDTRKLEAILRNLDKNVSAAAEQIASDIVTIAKENAPVASGELRDSIHVEKDGAELSVVADADHAVFIELGTSKMAAQPFLGPAAAKVRRNLAKYYKKVVTDG